ncbi:hypothetical protein D9757_011111 [Collybiopsis confluens]|uniref:WD40 repeat-like protein n=1 Tax=Collybiopsis confluens TaxID=2823264 RepID=A0A8H5GXH7_9AGAR|nr:hypothetical protein D9757_011111 [Collybiopsis confluens]
MSSQEYFAKFRPELQHGFEIDGKPASWFPGHPKQWGTELTRIDLGTQKEPPEYPGASTHHHLSTSDDGCLLSVTVGPDIHVYTVDYPSDSEDEGKPQIQLRQILRSGHGGRVGFAEFGLTIDGVTRVLVSSGSNRFDSRLSTARVWSLDGDEGKHDDGSITRSAAEAATRVASNLLLQNGAGTRLSQDALDGQNIAQSFEKVLHSAQLRIEVDSGIVLQGHVKHRAFNRDGSSFLFFPEEPHHHISVIAVDGLRERFRLEGHTGNIMWAAFSPDYEVIGTSSWDKTVRVWNATNGEPIHVLTGAANQSWSGAFSPDSKLIAAGAGDGRVRIWNVKTGELLHTFEGYNSWVRSLAFSPDSQTLAAGSRNACLQIFNVSTGKLLQQWWQMGVAEGGERRFHFLEVQNVSYTSRGLLLFKTNDNRVYMFDAGTGQKGHFEHGQDVSPNHLMEILQFLRMGSTSSQPTLMTQFGFGGWIDFWIYLFSSYKLQFYHLFSCEHLSHFPRSQVGQKP